MKEVTIYSSTGNLVALVDDEDFELVSQYRWNWHKGYARSSNRDKIRMHNLIMSPPDGLEVHHKNNNGLDNRRDNLEITTRIGNVRAYHTRGSVSFTPRMKSRPYRAKLWGVHLGYFPTEKEAREAIRAARGHVA